MKKNIKTLVYCIMVTVIFLTCSASAFAAEINNQTKLPSDMDTKKLTGEIVDMMNNGTFSKEIPRQIDSKDVDFSKAFKIYIDTDIFALKTNNFNEVQATLEKGTYIFYVPIYFENGDVYLFDICRPNPLPSNANELMTPEMIKEYQSTVGKWSVIGMEQYLAKENPFPDYYASLKSVIDKSGTLPLLVGSLPYFRLVVAVFPDKEGNIDELYPYTPAAVDWERLGLDQKKVGEGYDYNTVKEAINANPPRNDGLNGGGGGDYNCEW